MNMPVRLRSKFTAYVAIIVLIGFVPIILNNEFYTYALFLTMIVVILAESWNIIGGYAGQISLANASFFGVGVYTTALLWKAGWSPLLALPVSGLVAGGLAIGMTPTFRLRGIYFAIGTLFLNEAIRELMIAWDSVTGGARGVYLPISSPTALPYFYLAYTVAISVMLIIWKVSSSKLGIGLTSIREDEDAARALGVNTLLLKVTALVLSAIFTGVAGGIYAYSVTFVDPRFVFSLQWVVNSVFPAVVGGGGTIVGPILGSLLFSALSELLSVYSNYQLMIYGSLLVIVVLVSPGGLCAVIKSKIIGRIQLFFR